MGMDVFGVAPTNESGNYFRANIWWWHPLWDYCCDVAPDVIDEGLQDAGRYNAGATLTAWEAVRLADRLMSEMLSGATQAYAAEFARRNQETPYRFESQTVREFARFLGASGGCKVW